MPRPVDHRPDLRLAAGLGAVVVGSLTTLVLWAMAVRERLPDPVARHWGIGGEADGFSSFEATLAISVLIPVVLAVPLGVVAVVGRQPVLMRRMLAGFAAGVPVFVVVLVADSLRGQLDLADAAAAPAPEIGIGVGVLLGIVAGALVAALARDRSETARVTGRPPASAPRLRDPAVDLRWQRRSTVSPTLAGAFVATGVALVAFSAVISWWLLAIVLPVAVLLAGATRFTTTVDATGMTVTVGPVRLLRVPIDEIAEADVVDVDPFWEFGGWGLRVDIAGRTGVVTRKGEAIRIRRGDDSEVVVTVDDASTAAATLNTAADRRW